MYEVQYWKVPNFVKDAAEVEQIKEYMKSNAEFLKTLFLIVAAKSHFPTIKWLNYGEFINELKITDKKFEMSAVDRIFIAVTSNIDAELKGIVPDKDMSRF